MNASHQSPTHKAHLRLDEQIKAFLSKGGAIQEVASGIGASDRVGPKLPSARWPSSKVVR
ncbi:hypothetical protein SAMN02745962_02491 [Pseudomonas sp. LAIL14HWK12:I11]|jgi:hypothetical protein|uniref:hypothetical protein n=1 Tax=Pseudomonas TaxID=286 RepID=UPI000A0B05A1|nr:hypothetical protein PAGU2196_50930 [Pseudomonas sp. PAGU 2196]SMF24416.1 hypothetical protein SAMN02745962_02491 [Pseudomonas sp. LAIL14HWK12:I11]SMR74228.1 hypothetical protein SAMN05661028_01919 [Pseudomonas sp. LAIL14HWK12:I10]SOD03641.1 hypothetical protein SAMN05660296_02496 [Pseudomonas sp. LAIL14HWK12:I8]